MRFSRMIQTIDTHTEGEPTRTVIGGIGPIPGSSMGEKMLHLKHNMDSLRRTLMFEPRGHGVMSGAILTEPCDSRADIGVVYIETGGYLPMCGHDTIGCCTALVEAGIVEVSEGITEITLDTPAGLVSAKVSVTDGVAKSVSFSNVPAFVYAEDAQVSVPEVGVVTLDIAFGGNFFGIVDAARFGLEITPREAPEIIRAGNALRKAVAEQMEVRHPTKPFINEMTHVLFYSEPTHPDAHAKNAVVFPPGQIDRSPCGTGTSARLAVLYKKRLIERGQQFVHESIIGSLFRAQVLEEIRIEAIPAISSSVSGRAWVTGLHTFVIDPEDPLKEGFLLGA